MIEIVFNGPVTIVLPDLVPDEPETPADGDADGRVRVPVDAIDDDARQMHERTRQFIRDLMDMGEL